MQQGNQHKKTIPPAIIRYWHRNGIQKTVHHDIQYAHTSSLHYYSPQRIGVEQCEPAGTGEATIFEVFLGHADLDISQQQTEMWQER